MNPSDIITTVPSCLDLDQADAAIAESERRSRAQGVDPYGPLEVSRAEIELL
jgi:hypothetical protein